MSNARKLANRSTDTVSVKDFGAVGDGTTDDTAAIQAAVTYAVSLNAAIYWASGTYLTTSSIAGIHSVFHSGSGAIKRGSDIFYIPASAASTNQMYASASGNDANDGLSASQPFATVQRLFDVAKHYGPTLAGLWGLNLAAGTYLQSATLDGILSERMITIQGPDVGGHPNVPTAIMDGTGGVLSYGLFFIRGVKVHVKNIKCVNFTGGATSYGLVIDAGGYLQTTNVHTGGNGYAGISIDDGAIGRIGGGIHASNLFYGFRAHDNALFTFGYNGGASANRPQLTNNPTGIGVLTGAQGHVDYCDISGGAYGVRLEDGARAHVMGSASSGCSTADVYSDPSCTWYNDPSTVNTFGSSVPLVNRLNAFTLAQFDKTNSASYSDVPGLSVSLVKGTLYAIKGMLTVTAGAAGGVAVALGGTASATLRITGKAFNAATCVNSQQTNTMTGAVGSFTGVATEVYVDGTLSCTASGTLTIRFAQNAANGTASSVLSPSYLIATPIVGGSPY